MDRNGKILIAAIVICVGLLFVIPWSTPTTPPAPEPAPASPKMKDSAPQVTPPTRADSRIATPTAPPASSAGSANIAAESATPTPSDSSGVGKVVKLPSGLEYEILQVGTGATAMGGHQVSVLYTGKLENGTVFDTTANRNNQPLEFPLGAGVVIKGWDEGVMGMKVGEKRRLTIPANIAYGERGAGGVIPPGATLIFEVELVDTK